MEDERHEPWWKKGLRFECIGCGRCCRGEPGAVWFTPDEAQRMRAFLGLSEEDFEKRYVTCSYGRKSLKELKNGDCIFYKRDDDRCAIYKVRPLQCRLFPFWPSLMESPEAWDEAAKSCPGMGGGRYYPPELIRKFLAAAPFGNL